MLGVELKLHDVVPVAKLKVAPPSTDTSTRATVPPPVSLAVPVMLTGVPVNKSAPGLGEMIVEVGGVVSWITVTAICVGGSCTFPLLSTARLLIVAGPGVLGVQLKLHEVVPVAKLKVAPLSTDTSTRATVPPVSLAVPVMLTVTLVNTVAPDVGKVIAEVGADLSGFVVGFLGLLDKHPEENRIELTTTSPMRTPEPVTYRLVNI
jgi:hypothetical protein